jgi:hypothetical protein
MRAHKQIASTSRTAYADILATRRTRELAVLQGLRAYEQQYGEAPSAYELLEFLRSDNPVIDVNFVRPRLSEMKDAGRVTTNGKRRCAVTGKQVFTWRACELAAVPSLPTVPVGERPVQSDLF